VTTALGQVSASPLVQADAGPLIESDATVNLPNALTFASLALGAWWVADGPDWAAVLSVALDEADGRVARATGQESRFGSTYDWAADVALTALSLRKVGAPWPAIPIVATGQVILRERGYRPPVLSARGVTMLYGVVKSQGYLDKR
jgi:hypothetical protein